MPREYARHQRLGSELRRTLNELLRQEAKDPRLEGVAISEVELSGDLSQARAFFSLLDIDGDPEPAAAALASASGFLRSRIGKALRVRKTPALIFVHDDSAARGVALGELLRSDGPAGPERDPEQG